MPPLFGEQALGSWAEAPLGIQAATANLDIQAIGSWAGQSKYLSLGTWAATGNLDIQAIGSWAGQSRYLGLGT